MDDDSSESEMVAIRQLRKQVKALEEALLYLASVSNGIGYKAVWRIINASKPVSDEGDEV